MPVPMAVTENVTASPTHFTALTGSLVISGDGLTVRVAMDDVTEGVQEPLTTTSKVPASDTNKEEIV